MHRLLHIIALAALVMLLSCRHGQGAARALLDRAEALTPSRPDSALALLESIPATSLHPGEETALHALLLTQARYKCMYDETDDSLIRIATSWYDTHRDTRHRMLANFYLGYILMNRGSYGESVRHMLLAEDLATQLKDTFQMAMANRCLEMLNNNSKNYANALGYAKKTYELMKESRGMDCYTLEAMGELALSYNNAGNPSEACRIAGTIIDSAILMNDTVLMLTGLRVKATSQMQAKQYGRAIGSYRNVISLRPDAVAENDLYNYIFCALMNNDKALADSIVMNFGECSETEVVPDLYWIEKGNISKAYQSALNQVSFYDEEFKRMAIQEVSWADSEYHRRKVDEAIAQRNRMTIYIIVIGCVLFSAVIYILAMTKIRKARTLELMAVINSLSAEKNILIEKHFQRTNQLCDHLHAKSAKIDIDSLKNQLKSDLRDFCGESDDELLASANLKHPDMLARFDIEFKDMNPNDRRLFIYHLCGFSSMTMSVFFGCNIQSVYTRKSRLKSKISESESPHKDEYLKILS